jgi:import inner membrane translocase subunit TIM44
MFQESEMTAVLREIRKNDPNFDRENFIEYAHSTLIPVALESYLSGDLETMKEWCSEPVCPVSR